MNNFLELRDRKLRAVDKELGNLRQCRRFTVPLEAPVQYGWVRSYTVADYVTSPRVRSTLFDILKVIGTTQWSRNPDFHLRKGRKTPLLELAQSLRHISASNWEKNSFPDEWKRYFCLESERHHRGWHPIYVFAHRRMLEFKVEPHFVFERSYPDPVVERRIAELEQWLNHHYLVPRLDSLRGIRRSIWKSDPRRRVSLRVHREEIRQALQFPEVDLVPVIRRHCISLLAILCPA